MESRQISPKEELVGIVDDDSDISMLFADALRGVDSGISVFTFNDSLEALKHFTNNKEKYILVICDSNDAWSKRIGSSKEDKET